jgi:serine/threonine protein kinase
MVDFGRPESLVPEADVTSQDDRSRAPAPGDRESSPDLEALSTAGLPPTTSLAGQEVSVEAARAEPPGTSSFIGPYRLLEKLGEGGMGQVWLAEQTAPIRRKVALKLIKGAHYERAVIQRFELERQSLAVMEHPTIAKVFDAGATVDGQPYLVMEYVSGDADHPVLR